jgi:hypothetical protein
VTASWLPSEGGFGLIGAAAARTLFPPFAERRVAAMTSYLEEKMPVSPPGGVFAVME